ncbi:MAG TPA: alpha/beta fold hydrolase [Pyrinomonadaceae bacterium]|jgi:pimeloyl-ACP methyl ester carboxylesterase
MFITREPTSILFLTRTPLVIALMAFSSFASNATTEEQFRIPVEPSPLKVFLRHLAPARRQPVREGRVVLILHGGTLPSGASSAFRLDGHSWMDDLSDAGFDVWALDYLGYGGSDRYPEMSAPATANQPLGRAAQASRQVSAAVYFICKRQKVSKLSLISHSWGTLVAGVFATQEPNRVDRLVLYGPVTLRHQDIPPTTLPAYTYVTEEEQWKRFSGWAPSNEEPVLERRHFDVLGPAYIDSDPTSRTRTPPSVQVPGGPDADATDAWTGKFPYDPAKIKSPTLIIRGEWETITRDEDAHWLFRALTSAPIKRDVLINRATHLMHLEKNRYQVYREVEVFLEGRDTGNRSKN